MAAAGRDRARPARPTAVRHLAGVVGSFLAVGAAVATSLAAPAPSPAPTADHRPGTCHLAKDPNELIAIPSDTAPPVPCSEPHQTETMWLGQVTGPLAASKTRPNGELLNHLVAGQCSDYLRVRAYLGAGDADATWGTHSWARFPTAAEWARGDRTLVCQASAQIDTPAGPTVNFSLAGVMSTRRSAMFRQCRDATRRSVSCDRPHSEERAGPDAQLPPGPWPGDNVVAGMAAATCGPIVDGYLGQPLSARGDLTLRPRGQGQAAWNGGDRSVQCWIGNLGGGPTNGTLRAGLR